MHILGEVELNTASEEKDAKNTTCGGLGL